jgi:hypothetical protein
MLFLVLEALECDGSAEFSWALYGEDGFFSEDMYLQMSSTGLNLTVRSGQKALEHFLFDFLWCIVDEDACFGFALRHLS